MLPLPRFHFADPTDLAELVQLAGEPGSRLISGGTDLLPSMKHRLFSPARLVSTLRVPELRHVEPLPEGGLSIGAAVTLREVAAMPVVQRDYPALARAARTVATPTIQAMGTIGGNVMLDTRCRYYNQPAGWRAALGGCLKCDGSVCHVAPRGKGCYAAHSADTVPGMILADVSAVFATVHGERRVHLRELYGDDGRTWLQVLQGAVLVRVELPPPGAPIAYRKLRARGAIDYPQLLTAVQHIGDTWRCVISAVGPAPVLLEAGSPSELMEAAMAGVQPLTTHLASPAWRKKLVRVELGRAMAELGVG